MGLSAPSTRATKASKPVARYRAGQLPHGVKAVIESDSSDDEEDDTQEQSEQAHERGNASDGQADEGEEDDGGNLLHMTAIAAQQGRHAPIQIKLDTVQVPGIW